MRHTPDRLAELERLLRSLQAEPWQHDFLHTLRRFECLFDQAPRLGQAPRPAQEPLRLGQDVSMGFAPAALSAFDPGDGTRAPRLAQRFFGLLGPNGPLPLHLTEFVLERRRDHGDGTLAAFLDVLQHRLLTLFYRAWAQAQPTVSRDRPAQDGWSDMVGSLVGIGRPALQRRDAAGDPVKLFHAGWLVRQVRNADGLQALLTGFFAVPMRVEQFAGQRLRLPPSQRTRMVAHAPGSRLGQGTVLGSRVWDRQHRIRIHAGPLPYPAYEEFLPGGQALPRLLALMRQYLCMELDWDLCLCLARPQQPPLRLSRGPRLGWSTWLGAKRSSADVSDLVLDVEAVLRRRPAPRHPEHCHE